MTYPEPLPLHGSVSTRYANVRRAHRPSTEDLAWAELFAIVSPAAAKRARGTAPLPPMPLPNREAVTRAARRAGLDPWGLGMLLMGVYSSRTRGLELRVLVVGSARLTETAMGIAEKLVAELPEPPAAIAFAFDLTDTGKDT